MLKSLRFLGLVSGDYSTVTTTLDLYSQAIDTAKLEAQEEIALAITSTAAAD